MPSARMQDWILRIALQAAWAPVAVLALHFVAADGLAAYERWPNLDIPMHVLGGMAIAWLVHTASRLGVAMGVLGSYGGVVHAALMIGLTCAATIFWEFAEFLADTYLGTNMQGGDLNDTLLDMLLGMAGGARVLLVTGAAGRWPTMSKERVELPDRL